MRIWQTKLSVLAVAFLGVGVNCIVVASVGIRSLQAGQRDQSLVATFSPSSRARILEEHPQAQRATWVLSALTLIPFALLTGFLYLVAREKLLAPKPH